MIPNLTPLNPLSVRLSVRPRKKPPVGGLNFLVLNNCSHHQQMSQHFQVISGLTQWHPVYHRCRLILKFTPYVFLDSGRLPSHVVHPYYECRECRPTPTPSIGGAWGQFWEFMEILWIYRWICSCMTVCTYMYGPIIKYISVQIWAQTRSWNSTPEILASWPLLWGREPGKI